MASDVNVETIPFTAGEDIAGRNYEILKAGGEFCTDDTDLCVGVCYIDIPTRDPDTTGQVFPMAPINQPAIVKVKVSGAVAEGALLVPDGANDGKAKGVATQGDIPQGVTAFGSAAEAATADNDIIRMYPGYVPGTRNPWRGAWVAGVYYPGDFVTQGGNVYICLVERAAADTSNPSVDTTGWDQIT